MEFRFWKYEGAGNDFIMVDGRDENRELPGHIVRMLCDRHRGIGADGLIILSSEEGYDFRMSYYNSDGGQVNMCGNGARCITLFADHLGIGADRKSFIGRDGEHISRIISHGIANAVIEIGMVPVDTFEFSESGFYMNTGVPHYVEFVEDLDSLDVKEIGKQIRFSEKYRAEGGTNVNFVKIEGYGEIKVRTYERGVEDETLACGTGATACAIATRLYAQADCSLFNVTTRGGDLGVSFSTEDNLHFDDIRLTGPARKVFEGSVNTEYLDVEMLEF